MCVNYVGLFSMLVACARVVAAGSRNRAAGDAAGRKLKAVVMQLLRQTAAGLKGQKLRAALWRLAEIARPQSFAPGSMSTLPRYDKGALGIDWRCTFRCIAPHGRRNKPTELPERSFANP